MARRKTTSDETAAAPPPLPVQPESEKVVEPDVGTPAPIRDVLCEHCEMPLSHSRVLCGNIVCPNYVDTVMREITVEDIADVVDIIALTVADSNPQPVQVHPDIPPSPNHLVGGGS